jgi:DNA-binding transcriptional LysR family regulator
LDANLPVSFTELVTLPLVIPRSPSGVGTLLQNAALRTKVNVSYRITTDSLQVMKSLISAGLAYGVLPRSACRREVDDGRLHFAPICDPVLTQQLGLAATPQLELPRELTVKVGETIREEVAALIKSGQWSAEFLAPQPWNPNVG